MSNLAWWHESVIPEFLAQDGKQGNPQKPGVVSWSVTQFQTTGSLTQTNTASGPLLQMLTVTYGQHMYIHMCIHMHKPFTHKHTHVQEHTCINICTYTCTHSQEDTKKHTHKHLHTHSKEHAT